MSHPRASLCDMDEALGAVAQGQYGLFTRRQAQAACASGEQIRYRVANGSWVEVDNWVYRHSTTPVSYRQRVLAACLATDGVASHHTAAVLWGWAGRRSEIEIIAPDGRRSTQPTVVTHRSSDLVPGDVTRQHGIPLTGPVRTLADVGPSVGYRRLEKFYNRAANRGLVTFVDVASMLARVGRKGRTGAALLRRLVEAKDPGRAPTQSDLETLCVQVLRQAGLPEPECQHRLRLAGRWVFVDLAYPQERVAIELDGYEPHAAEVAFHTDRARQNLVVLAGWLPLRFTWHQLVHFPESVLTAVLEARTLGHQLLVSRFEAGCRTS